jgi:hypothetical protein
MRYMQRMARKAVPSSTARVSRLRERLRADGFRPVQFWLPDTRSQAFADQVARDIAAVGRLSRADAAMLDAFERLGVEEPE